MALTLNINCQCGKVYCWYISDATLFNVVPDDISDPLLLLKDLLALDVQERQDGEIELTKKHAEHSGLEWVEGERFECSCGEIYDIKKIIERSQEVKH